MKRILLILNVVFSCISSAYSRDNRYSIELNSLCKFDKDLYGYRPLSCSGCPELIEKKQLQKYKNKIVRVDKNTIKLNLSNGKSISVKNNYDPNDKMTRMYFFREYLPSIGYYIFQVEEYESCDFIFVNGKNVKEFGMLNLPIISPDKNNIAINLTDLGGMSPYADNRISIYNLSNDALTEVWSLSRDARETQFYNVEWIDNNTLVFNMCSFQNCSVPKTSVKLINGKWQLLLKR